MVAALWRHLAARMVVVESLRVYTWSAYAPGTCTDINAARLVAELEPEDLERGVYPLGALFPARTARQLSGCSLRYSGVAWPPFVLSQPRARLQDKGFSRGVDVDMLRAFSHRKKMTLVYVALPDKEHRWGGLVNGSWTGLLGLLQRGETDIIMGGFSLLPDRLQNFQPTSAYVSEVTS